MVNLDEPDVFTEVGLKLALVRRGRPETLRLTVPLNPLPGVMVTAYPVLEPRATLALAGVTEMPKSAVTMSVTPAVWVKVPLVAVIVSG